MIRLCSDDAHSMQLLKSAEMIQVYVLKSVELIAALVVHIFELIFNIMQHQCSVDAALRIVTPWVVAAASERDPSVKGKRKNK